MATERPLSKTRRPRVRIAAIAVAVSLALGAAKAHALFIVNQPWVKPGVKTSEAYMVLDSTEGAALLGARSPVATRVTLRGPGPGGDRERAKLELPAGVEVALRPGGERIALSGLTRTLKLGEHVLLTLTIETVAGGRQEIMVDAEVRKESPLEAERREHRH
jgi:copper(I)-binding protein